MADDRGNNPTFVSLTEAPGQADLATRLPAIRMVMPALAQQALVPVVVGTRSWSSAEVAGCPTPDGSESARIESPSNLRAASRRARWRQCVARLDGLEAAAQDGAVTVRLLVTEAKAAQQLGRLGANR